MQQNHILANTYQVLIGQKVTREQVDRGEAANCFHNIDLQSPVFAMTVDDHELKVYPLASWKEFVPPNDVYLWEEVQHAFLDICSDEEAPEPWFMVRHLERPHVGVKLNLMGYEYLVFIFHNQHGGEE